MRHLTSLLVASASISSLAAAAQPPAGQPPAGQPPAAGAPAASQAQPPSLYKNFGQLTKDAVVRKGFFDTYQKEDKLYLAIPQDRFGVDFLMEGAKDKNGNPYNVMVETLVGRGVTFDVCEITLKSRKLDRKQFIPESVFVPSGVAEIAKLQARGGYAYVKP